MKATSLYVLSVLIFLSNFSAGAAFILISADGESGIQEGPRSVLTRASVDGDDVSYPAQLPSAFGNEVLYHSNGFVYYLFGEEDYSYVDGHYTYLWDLYLAMEPDNGSDLEMIELDMPVRPKDRPEGRLIETDSGDIAGLIWYEVDPQGSSDKVYATVAFRFRVGVGIGAALLYDAETRDGSIPPPPTGDPTSIDTSNVERLGDASEDEPVNIAIVEVGSVVHFGFYLDGLYHVYGLSEEGTLDSNLEMPLREVARKTIWIANCFGKLGVIRQVDASRVVMDRYGPDYFHEEADVIYTFPDATGWDNAIRAWSGGGRLYLFVYEDELLEGSYSKALAFVFDPDISMTRSTDLLDEGAGLDRADLYPSYASDRIFALTGNGSAICIFDLDLNLQATLQLSYLEPVDVLFDICSAYTVSDQVVAIYESGYLRCGISLYPAGEMPKEGYLGVKGDRSIIDKELTVKRGIVVEEGGKLEIMNCRLMLGNGLAQEDCRILIRGTIGMENTTIEEMTGGDVYNEGEMILVDSCINVSFYNYGNVTSKGKKLFFDISDRPEFRGGDIRFVGLYLDDEVVGSSPFVRSSWFDDVDVLNITLEGCTVVNKEGLIASYGPCAVHLRNTTLSNVTDLYQTYGSFVNRGGVGSMSNCIVSDVSGLRMIKDEKARIYDCEFMDLEEGIISEEGDIEIVDTMFENCSVVLSSGREDPITEGSLRLSGCSFNNCRYPISNPVVGTLGIDNCTFIDCDRAVLFYQKENASIRDCIFRDNNVSIKFYGLGFGDIYKRELHINHNTFIGGRAAILYGESDIMSLDHHSYEREDDILTEIGWDLVDCRYNRFRFEDPGDVAGYVSEGIYFLPYYTLEGELITTDDDDLDGMDDDWENRRGFDSSFYYDRYMDPDRDWYSNYEEFRSGTDPLDGGSNPAEEIRSTAPFFGLVFIYLPLVLLVSYFFYFQFAAWNGRIERFSRRYREAHRMHGIRPTGGPHREERTGEGADLFKKGRGGEI